MRGPSGLTLALLLTLGGCAAGAPGAGRTPDPTPASASPTRSPSPSPTAEPSTPAPSPTSVAAPATCGSSKARKLIRFYVKVESDVPESRAAIESFLRKTYCDTRSWTASGQVRFRAVGKLERGVTLIRLASVEGVKKHCSRLLGEPASGNYSCANHSANEMVLNHKRWKEGAPDFNRKGGTLTQYRQMVSNHEMGHILDMRHQFCQSNGAPAPVMQQQSISMTSSSTGKTCKPNAWPLDHELRRVARRWS